VKFGVEVLDHYISKRARKIIMAQIKIMQKKKAQDDKKRRRPQIRNVHRGMEKSLSMSGALR